MHDVVDRLPVADLGRVDRGLEVVDRKAVLGERLRLGLRRVARVGQLLVGRDDLVEPLEVLRCADEDGRVLVPHRRLADRLVVDPVGALGDGLHVVEDVGVRGELPLRSHLEPEELLGCLDAFRCGRQGDPVRRLRGGGGRDQAGPEQGDRRRDDGGGEQSAVSHVLPFHVSPPLVRGGVASR